MEKNSEKILAVSIIEMLISILGFITFFIMFILVNTQQRIIFLLAAIYFVINIRDTFKEIREEKIKRKVRKYSMRTIDARSKRKLSY